MIELFCSVMTKPVSDGKTTTYGSTTKRVRVDAIQKNGQGSYVARLAFPEEDAPHQGAFSRRPGEPLHESHRWVLFRESANPGIRLPVLRLYQVHEV